MAAAAKDLAARSGTSDARTSDPILALLEAIRVLELATSRFRTATAQTWRVTVTDSLVMSNLAMAGGRMTPRDLGRRLMISSGTLTSMLDRLQDGGYVVRVPNPTDRRSLLIELTDKGRTSLFYTRELLGGALEKALAGDAQGDAGPGAAQGDAGPGAAQGDAGPGAAHLPALIRCVAAEIDVVVDDWVGGGAGD